MSADGNKNEVWRACGCLTTIVLFLTLATPWLIKWSLLYVDWVRKF
jgi:hypothetical protein